HGAHVAVLVLPLRPPAQAGRKADPDGEIDDAANDEARLIEPRALVLNQLARRIALGRVRAERPAVKAIQPDGRDRQKQDEHQPERVRSGFELPPDQQSPARAPQILDHQKSQTTERDARPEEKSDQIRTEESISGGARFDRANNPGEYADQPYAY